MKNLLIILSLFFSCHLIALEQPYTGITVLPEYPFGYYHNRQQIQALFDGHPIRTVIEIGSWIGGGSTRHFGELLKERKGKVYAVDTWLGSTTQQPGQVHFQPILSVVYEQFLSNMIHWNLTDIVIPCRMKSLEAVATLKVNPDLIYIDGEHTWEAVYQDLTAWYPLVKEKGILCGDDWTWVDVRAAVEQFANENNLAIKASGNFWRLYNP